MWGFAACSLWWQSPASPHSGHSETLGAPQASPPTSARLCHWVTAPPPPLHTRNATVCTSDLIPAEKQGKALLFFGLSLLPHLCCFAAEQSGRVTLCDWSAQLCRQGILELKTLRKCYACKAHRNVLFVPHKTKMSASYSGELFLQVLSPLPWTGNSFWNYSFLMVL